MVRAKDDNARIATVAADLEAEEFPIEPNHWDLICVSFYMRRELFGAIRDGLKPGGLLCAAFPMSLDQAKFDDRAGVKPMRAEFLIEPGELASFFRGFEILHDAETTPPPPKRRMAEFWARKLDDTIS